MSLLRNVSSLVEANSVYCDAFYKAAANRNLAELHAECATDLERGANPNALPYVFMAASRTLLHDPAHWRTVEGTWRPSEVLLEGLARILANPDAINCRDNYYWPVVNGIFHYIQQDYERAYASFSSAARPPDFYRIVKDDFGGGASFAKAFPDDRAFERSESRLSTNVAMVWKRDGGAKLVYSVACDPIYAEAFAEPWIESVVALATGDVGLHIHIVSRTNVDDAFVARLINASARIPGGFWVSVEPGIPYDRAYFAAARLLHGSALLRLLDRPVVFADADAFISHEARQVTEMLSQSEVHGLLSYGPFNGYLPWRTFSAGWLLAPATEAAIAFLDHVARCIKYLWDERSGRNWWIDQFGLETARLTSKRAADRELPSIYNKWPKLFGTSEEYKISKISDLPKMKALMGEGMTYWPALHKLNGTG
jgi:hypothetical protein